VLLYRVVAPSRFFQPIALLGINKAACCCESMNRQSLNGQRAACARHLALLPHSQRRTRVHVARPADAAGVAPTARSSSNSTPVGSYEKQPPSSLNLPLESAQPIRANHGAVKTTGLRRAPLSGGVKTATQRFDLPNPAVAVRNLVEQAQFAHLCTSMSHMHHR